MNRKKQYDEDYKWDFKKSGDGDLGGVKIVYVPKISVWPVVKWTMQVPCELHLSLFNEANGRIDREWKKLR